MFDSVELRDVKAMNTGEIPLIMKALPLATPHRSTIGKKADPSIPPTWRLSPEQVMSISSTVRTRLESGATTICHMQVSLGLYGSGYCGDVRVAVGRLYTGQGPHPCPT